MEIYLNRYYLSEWGTSGNLYIDGKFYCHTLELPWKDNKRKESCVPEGKYNVVFREEPTPMTMKYRERYDFFNFHLMLEKVKNRSGIYIHVGNTIKDSYGCILIGNGTNTDHYLSDSTKRYKDLYGRIAQAKRSDEAINMTIDRLGF